MSTAGNFIRSTLVRALALAALTAGTALAGSSPHAEYDSSGSGPSGPIMGDVRFGTDSASFQAVLATRGVFGGTYTASGSYTELNLFVIGFWSFEGFDNGVVPGARGSGIRLFFGLFVFGSLQSSSNELYSFSGLFSSIVQALPPDELPARIGSPSHETGLAAFLRRRTLAIERC